MKLPSKIFGISTEEAYNKYLEEPANKPKSKKIIIPDSTDIQNLKDYIILEGGQHGSYSYPDLLVSKAKFHFKKTWPEAHEELSKEDSIMLTMRQFADFMKLLRTGKAYDGTGAIVPSSELGLIYDDAAKKGGNWRSEWLDADLKVVNGILHINYEHRFLNGILTPSRREKLENCLMEDRGPGISLDEWIDDANSQGLPKPKIKKGELWYWFPRSDNNSVARFGAVSVGVSLGCSRGPRGSNAALGVRRAKIFHRK